MSITLSPLAYPQSSSELLQKLRHLALPVLLSSGSEIGSSSRFDIISAAPEKILRSYIHDNEYKTSIESNDGSVIQQNGNPIHILKQQFDEKEFGHSHDNELPFTGGALGYFSYELLHPEFSISARSDGAESSPPEMLVGIYYWAIVVDHLKKNCTLVMRPQCSLNRDELIKTLAEPAISSIGEFKLEGKFNSNYTFPQYEDAYDKIIAYIHAGDCYQVNLTQRFSAPCKGDSFKAFTHLQALANAPFAAYLEDGDHAVLSFSPERFLKVSNKVVLTEPIKGTRPRHSDPQQDQANLEELKNSDKDKAENLMIVDLLRNDLGRVCKTGSVSVEALFKAHSFTNVHHLISVIKGELSNADEVFELLEASFPGGSITGTPKIRAMEIINELETRLRSVYCGSIAYIDFNGDMDSSICIRTLVSDGENIHCWGGGAIVADSTAKDEYQETLDKISLFLDGLSGQ